MTSDHLSSRYQPYLNQELRRIVDDSQSSLRHVLQYHLGWVSAEGQARLTGGGKLLRPFLCLRACEASGGDWKKALPAAAALELLHNFTLIHDDIEDNDHERRGIATVWHIWGLAQGINAGDAMHVLSRLALLGLEDQAVDPSKVLHAARFMEETCLRLCEGQYLDISFESRMDITIEDYLNMIEGKTAALFACSMKIGTMLGTDDKNMIDRLSKFGRDLGMAFQVRDDILGIWGDNKKTGKPVGSDILHKKKTLPIIHLLQEDDGEMKQKIISIYDQASISERDITQILQYLGNINARHFCEEMISRYTQAALFHLDDLPINASAKDDFISLLGFMAGREY